MALRIGCMVETLSRNATAGRANAWLVGVLVVALAVMLPLGAPSGAGADGPPTAKPKKCKKNQVLVKIGRKKRCVPVNQVFPPSSDVDSELAFAQAALGLDLTDVRSPSPAAAKAGRKALLKAVPAAVALLDQLVGAAPRSRAARRAPCGSLPQATATVTSDGANVSVSIGPGGAAFGLETERDGVTYRIRYDSNAGLCDLEVPRCPTADGTVDARGTQRQRMIVEAIKAGQVLSRQVTTLSRETKVHGQVADDALLDTIDIHDVARVDVDATGSDPVRSTVERDLTGVNMRDLNASYYADASRASVRISGDRAVHFFDTRNFASHIGDVRGAYRRAESGPFGWANFEKFEAYCPKLVWDPPSKTKTLKKFTPWDFGGRVEASSDAGGGTVSKARWEISDQANGTFTLRGANAPQVTVDVVVTNAGPQVVATAKFKIKSTAGVARDTYEIKTEDIPTINYIAGTFDVVRDFGAVFRYAGNVTFARFTPAIYGGASGTYFVSGGQYTVTASGLDSSGATGCQQSGSKQFSLRPNDGNIGVQGTGNEQIEPYQYSFRISAGRPEDTMTITRHSCPPGAESQEGTTYDIPVVLDVKSRDQETSDHGVAYAGSYSDNMGGGIFTTGWSFTGTETPP